MTDDDKITTIQVRVTHLGVPYNARFQVRDSALGVDGPASWVLTASTASARIINSMLPESPPKRQRRITH